MYKRRLLPLTTFTTSAKYVNVARILFRYYNFIEVSVVAAVIVVVLFFCNCSEADAIQNRKWVRIDTKRAIERKS